MTSKIEKLIREQKQLSSDLEKMQAILKKANTFIGHSGELCGFTILHPNTGNLHLNNPDDIEDLSELFTAMIKRKWGRMAVLGDKRAAIEELLEDSI